MTSPGPPQKHVCPVCNAPWRGSSNLCASCGADLYDPDVQAFAGGQAPGSVPVGANDPALEAEAGSAGVLGTSKVLGVSLAGLQDGSALRRLGLVGAGMLLVAFVLPALRLWKFGPPLRRGEDRQLEVTLRYSWDLLNDGHALALVYPLVGALVGLVVAFVPRIPTHVRASLLALVGLAGFVLCLGPLGGYGLAPTQATTIVNLALLVAGPAMIVRVLVPSSQPARHALVVAAALFVVGILLPVGDLAARLPSDYQAGFLDVSFTHAVPLVQIAKGVDRRLFGLFFVALWLLAPLVLLPLAALLARKQPRGVWDKDGVLLVPLARAIVLYIPVLYALMAVSMIGWDDQASKSAIVGRMRLFAMALPFALWAQIGFLGALGGRRRDVA